MSSETANIKVASLFCGCGGSDLGLIGDFTYLERHYPQTHFEIAYAVDFDKAAVDTYNTNFKVKASCADVCDVDFNNVPDVDMLIGGFPCQSFSTVNPTKDTNDARANLYKQIVRFLQCKKPKYFICENVKGLMTLQKGAILRKIYDELTQVGYKVQIRLLRAVDYGIPQRRERVFIVGIRNDLDITFNFPAPCVSSPTPLSAVIDDLALDNPRYYFSERAILGMKNAKNNMKRGLWQKLDEPCLTITSHLAKTSINSRDPILLVDPDKELYRRFTPREAARIQSFPDDFIFPGSEASAYRQIGNAIPPVLMWHVVNSLGESIGRVGEASINVSRRSFAPIQLTLFEPQALYISKSQSKDITLIGSCRLGLVDWIKNNYLYTYPIDTEDIEQNPELLSANYLIVRHKKNVIGTYRITSVSVRVKKELNQFNYPSKSSRHKADTKYLLYSLEECPSPDIDLSACNFKAILGKGVKK